MYLFAEKEGYGLPKKMETQREAVRSVREQFCVDRKQASNELCAGMHNPLSRRSEGSECESARKIHKPGSRCGRSRQTQVLARREDQECWHWYTADGAQRRGWLAFKRKHNRDFTRAIEHGLRLERCSAPPLSAEGHSIVEDGSLQLLLEERHTVPEVFG